MTDSPATGPAETTPTPTPTSQWRPNRKHPITIVLIVLIALAAVTVFLRVWGLLPFQGSVQKTENAYVRGRTTIISPQVSGYIVAVLVEDYGQVKAGQVLARVDDRTYQAKVEQARATLSEAQANLSNSVQAHASRSAQIGSQIAALGSTRAELLKARADMARADDLGRDGSISIRERDQTLAALRQAEANVHQADAAVDVARQDLHSVDVGREALQAQVDVARAQLDAAQIDLDHTNIRAPEAGELGEIGVRLGQYVTNGTELMAMVPSDRWVIADYKEAQTAHMAPGQSASFTVDALGGARFTGRVEQLAPATGSEFAVLKPDNATGNFIKVPQRIGVRIVLDSRQGLIRRLRPGMSVEVTVNTRESL
jgi:multidrug resistance efflux pump